MLAAANRRNRRVLDIQRRMKIRLTDAKGNDVLPLTQQRVDLGQNDESVFGAE